MQAVWNRIRKLEEGAFPSGTALVAWSTGADGLAVARWDGQGCRHADGESFDDFEERVSARIGNRPIVWLSPLDADL